MAGLFASGHIVDLILGVIAVELLIGPRWLRRNGAGVTRVGLFLASLPGIFLLLALRAALTQASWMWVAGFLALSFPAHLLDLWRRRP